jgi:hypothetical protein
VATSLKASGHFKKEKVEMGKGYIYPIPDVAGSSK